MIKQEDILKIGHFAKPHGVKGEITLVSTVEVFDDVDDPYIVCEMEGIPVPFFIEEYRYRSNSSILLKIENMDSEEEVRTLVGKEVFYPKHRIKEESQKMSRSSDSIVGYMVSDERIGELGRIEAVDDSTLNILLQIAYKGEELLVPLSEELVVSIDDTKQTIVMSLPEGLIE